jgi:hypothetical protein
MQVRPHHDIATFDAVFNFCLGARWKPKHNNDGKKWNSVFHGYAVLKVKDVFKENFHKQVSATSPSKATLRFYKQPYHFLRQPTLDYDLISFELIVHNTIQDLSVSSFASYYFLLSFDTQF